MSKVTKKMGKILLHSLSGVVFVAILLFLAIALAFSLPRVQTFAADIFTNYISNNSDVNLSVERISLESLTKLTAENLYIEDLEGDTLLYVNHLTGRIDRHALLQEGSFRPYDVTLENTLLYLKTYHTRKANIDYVIENISSLFEADSTKKGGEITIGNIHCEDFRFRLYDERTVGRTPEGSIDYSDMDIDISTANFNSIHIRNGVVGLYGVSGLNALDKSGASLKDSSFGKLVVSKGKLDFADVDFYSGGTHLLLPYLIIEGENWRVYSQFCDNVRLRVETAGSSLEPVTAGRYVNALGRLSIEGDGIVGTFDGTVNDFVADIRANLYNSEVEVAGHVERITRFSEMSTNSAISLTTTPEKVQTIYSSLVNTPLPENIAQLIAPFEEFTLSGTVNMHPNEVYIYFGELITPLGSADIDGRLNYSDGVVSFDGEITGDDIQVGEIVSMEGVGATDLAMEGTIAVKDGKIEGEIDAEIESIVLGAYEYNNLALEATMHQGNFAAHATSADPHFAFTMDGDGSLGTPENAPEYNLMLSLEKADLGAMGVARREGTSLISGNVEATLKGRTIDEMVGRAMVNNLFWATPTDTLSTEIVNISLRGGEQDKSFTITSPIFDVDYHSTASYGEVLAFMTETIPTALPLIGEKSEEKSLGEPLGSRLYMADDYSNLSVKIIEGKALASILLPGAEVASMTSLEMEFSPSAKEFSLTLGSDNLKMGDIVAENLEIDADGFGTDLNLIAQTSTLRTGGVDIPQVSIEAHVGGGDNVALEVLMSNSDAPISGRLGVEATLKRDKRGEIIASATLSDSYLLTPIQRWALNVEGIDYTPRGVAINHFSADAGASSIDIDGTISTSSERPLRLSFDNIALGEWVEILGYMQDVEGSLSGDAVLYSALEEPYGKGTLSVSPITAAGVGIDPITLEAYIAPNSTEALATLTNTRSNTTLAEGLYDYQSGEYDARISIDKVELSTIAPLLKSVVDDLEGSGKIALNIAGERGEFGMNGDITIDNLATQIGYTGADYNIPHITLAFDNNKGTLAPTRIEDKEGGWAMAEGHLTLGKEVSFGLSLEPHNLIAIDLPEDRESTFYGKVYAASGGIKLDAQNATTIISGGLRTGNNSVFNLPLKGNSDFRGADFVTFVDKSTDMAGSSFGGGNNRSIRLERPSTGNSNLIVDMMLGVDTDTKLRLIIDPETDNVIEAKGNAELGITMDKRKDEFAIRGDYQIDEGVYNFNFQNLITKQFSINPGSYLRWNGSPLDANIDVAATYSLKTSLAPLLGAESTASRSSTPVDCIVNLTGSLSKVDVSFDINVPTANTEYQSILSSYFSSQEMMATQFVYLLALGNFYSDSSTGQGTTAGTAGTAIGLDFLATQVSKLVSNDAYKFNLKYKAIDDTSSSYSIDFQTDIIDDRLTLELEANVDTGDYYQSIGENNNQLTGGGAITLRLDEAGNVNLKGFSRTIDRFDENQGLQENGVGLYFKRSFNRLSDLWRKKEGESEEESEKNNNFAPTSTEGTTNNPTEEQTKEDNNE